MDGETFACNSSRLVPLGLFSEKPSLSLSAPSSLGVALPHTPQFNFSLGSVLPGLEVGLTSPAPPTSPATGEPFAGLAPLQGSDL